FALLWGDDLVVGETPALRQLLDARDRLGGSAAGAARVGADRISRYGVFAGRPERGAFRVSAMVEKPAAADAPSDLAAIHGYVLEPSIFDVLAAQAPGRGGEIWLVDAVSSLAGREPVWALELKGER